MLAAHQCVNRRDAVPVFGQRHLYGVDGRVGIQLSEVGVDLDFVVAICLGNCMACSRDVALIHIADRYDTHVGQLQEGVHVGRSLITYTEHA